MCYIEATTESSAQRAVAVQDFSVATDPTEHVHFVTSPPSRARLGGSYDPSVGSTASVELSFFSATPSVCDFDRKEPLRFFLAGTCAIDVRQSGSSKDEAPEARQSFTVYGPRGAITKLGTLTIEIYHEPAAPPRPVTFTRRQGVENTPQKVLWSGDATVELLGLGSESEREVTVEHGQVVLQLKPGQYRILGAKAADLFPITQTLDVQAGEQSVAKLDIGG